VSKGVRAALQPVKREFGYGFHDRTFHRLATQPLAHVAEVEAICGAAKRLFETGEDDSNGAFDHEFRKDHGARRRA
jgi:hypothetical protein